MKVATFLQNLHGGGAERVATLLMNGLAQDHQVSLIVAQQEGPYFDDLDSRVELHSMGGRRILSTIIPLARWLRRERPDVFMSHMTHVNVAASLAIKLSGTQVPLLAVEHNQMDLNFERLGRPTVRWAYRSVPYVYPTIERVVCVSDGVADSVRRFTRRRPCNLVTINNPVVTPRLAELAAGNPAHPWFHDTSIPVVLGCGRLVEQKDFATLILAFQEIRRRRKARLLILGEGPQRAMLEELTAQLGLSDDVAMPGFDPNPFAAMRAASVFVLSSRWEGLPTVLIEALAAGAVVVSTDCPSGPFEVLKGGALGPLVPVGDAAALADGIERALVAPTSAADRLAQAGNYTVSRAVSNYEELLRQVIA